MGKFLTHSRLKLIGNAVFLQFLQKSIHINGAVEFLDRIKSEFSVDGRNRNRDLPEASRRNTDNVSW